MVRPDQPIFEAIYHYPSSKTGPLPTDQCLKLSSPHNNNSLYLGLVATKPKPYIVILYIHTWKNLGHNHIHSQLEKMTIREGFHKKSTCVHCAPSFVLLEKHLWVCKNGIACRYVYTYIHKEQKYHEVKSFGITYRKY